MRTKSKRQSILRHKIVFTLSLLSALYGLWSGLAYYFPTAVPYYMDPVPDIGQSNFMTSLSVLAICVVRFPKMFGWRVWITDIVLVALFVSIGNFGPDHPKQLIWFLGFCCLVLPLMPQRDNFGADRLFGRRKKANTVQSESIDALNVVNSDPAKYSGEIGKTTRTKHHWQ